MKRFYVLVALVVFFISNAFASQTDFRRPLSLRDIGRKPLKQNRFQPTYTFAIEPVSIVDNFYDYFPGSYGGKPIQRVQTPNLDGHWMIFHAKTTASSNRKVYKTYIDNTGAVQSNLAFAATDVWEGFPSMDLTEGGRPLLAYHADIDDEATNLEVVFGYDAVIGGVAIGMHSDPLNLIDNPVDIDVDGTIVSTNEFIWPSVQIGDSPLEGSQRVYVLAKNATQNGAGISENVVIYYKDFTESNIENQMFDATAWSSTSIPILNEWNLSEGEFRRPYLSFIVKEDKLYYIGYHIAYSEAGDAGIPLNEGTITAFVCDNYGEGQWQQYSTFGDFDAINPPYIDPATGEPLVPAQYYFDDVTDDMLSNKIGQSSHFSSGIDGQGRIHFPAFYTLSTNEGSYYPGLHTVKNITFDTNRMEWYLAEVYPQQENGSEPLNPNSLIDITQYDSQDLYPMNDLWLWWDQDGDGEYEEVLDDGTYDGVDDGVTSADTEYWGMPVLTTIWPYMYWDSAAADNAMMFHMHTAQITDANEHGLMAMIWQDSDKARLANTYPESYPEYLPYQNMTELVISVSGDFGFNWSEPIFLNGIDTPEMDGQIPEFPYLGDKMDFIGYNLQNDPIGRLHIMYLDDETYGSSTYNIGQASGGSMKYMAIDITFSDYPTENTDNEVAPSIAMLNQNYPNPFNPTTRINYNVLKTGSVKLNVYNVKGQLVKTLVNTNQNVGMHNVVWNGDNNAGNEVSSGLYYYKIDNAGRSEIKKMLLMK